MEKIIGEVYAVFGVFGFIVVGMGFVIKYLLAELRAERKDNKEFLNKVAEAIAVIKTILDKKL
jgi:hypothetical protein